MENGNKFKEVYSIDVSEYIEKKGNLSYLSWANAWASFKKVYPRATYKIDQFDGAFCSGNDKMGYMVRTEVTAEDLTYEMWLPVMDMRNNTIMQPKATEINKTIMRCLTKNLAMFGLGLYIYAGEDLPEVDDNVSDAKAEQKTNAQTSKPAPKIAPISSDKAKRVEPLTKAELVEKYGCKNAVETMEWFENKFGKPVKEWTEDETESARAVLEQKKIKREREAAQYREEMKKAGAEFPFDV